MASSSKSAVSGWSEARRKIKKSKALYAMFAFPLVYFLIFHYAPMVGNLMAFQDYSIIKGFFGSPWAGTKYFEQFLNDSYFWQVVRNTVLLNLYSLIFFFPAPIVFALLLNELRLQLFKRFVQSITYIPHFLSTVVVAGMLVNFLSSDGLINQFRGMLGADSITFLSMPEWFRTIFIGSDIWQGLGWGSIIYLAALTGIDPTLYEAATIDGASRWRKMRHITIPGIMTVIMVMLLLNLGHMLSVGFEKILLLYSGPTYETADVIQTYVYRRGLIDSDFSFAAAVGIFQSVLSFVLVISANQLSKKFNGARLF
ncbi:sugar ABC transporter permease [Cohnella sp. CIP 111063]|uniref:ABC transporter permease n=1 Tax=unclassified Cohnella TaxID=2636738 RepID=UPI000B8C3237|nr:MULTISPECIES: ABC transporter permease subunit [unclassified Cohnella]OXS54736.1 sugar ABC transporter permease [Cohnella sp. CIP 111063]PRX64573.1 carbohydrate ABC transporter membrane protein 1 (CUT1 family) [Cohnella sp. SGD-V74]